MKPIIYYSIISRKIRAAALLAALSLAVSSALYAEGAWTTYNTDNSALPTNSVNCIAAGHWGGILAGTDQGIISFYGADTWDSYTDITSSAVYSAAKEASSFWFGMKGRLMRFTTPSDYEIHNASPTVPLNIGIYSIAVDTDGYKWMRTFGSGVVRFKDGNWDRWLSTDIPDNDVRSVAIDSAGTKWIATAKGAAKLPNGENVWIKYTQMNTNLPSNAIYSVFIDSRGNVWFGTLLGLSMAESGDMDNLVTYTVDRLLTTPINTITEDNDGHIWVGTALGAASFDGRTWTTHTISNSGIAGNNIKDITVGGDGSIWFATLSGVSRLQKKEVTVTSGRAAIQGGAQGYINPAAKDVARIIFNTDGPGRVSVKIYTSQGMLVWETSRATNGENDYIIWDCGNLSGSTVSSGVYSAHIKGPGLNTVKRIPVVR